MPRSIWQSEENGAETVRIQLEREDLGNNPLISRDPPKRDTGNELSAGSYLMKLESAISNWNMFHLTVSLIASSSGVWSSPDT